MISAKLLKRVFEQMRDELTDMPKGVLIYPMALDVLASSELILHALASRLNVEADL